MWRGSTVNLTFCFRYRLAPEHPYPIPLEDCMNATIGFMLMASKFGVDAARIAVAGRAPVTFRSLFSAFRYYCHCYFGYNDID